MMISTVLLHLVNAPIQRPLAYLDPGSGSFILQVLVATLLGGLFLLKSYWQRIVSFFRRRSSKENSESEE